MPAPLGPILDTHQHLIYLEKWPYSWPLSIPALAGKAFGYEDYLKAIVGTGIARTVFMETTPDDPHWKREADFVYGVAAQSGSLIGGVIANCRPENEDFEDYLESVLDARLVGFRRILHVEPDELSRSPIFAENLRLMGKVNLSFDLCVRADQIPLAIDLVRAAQSVQFILDHCGNPDIAADGGKGPAKSWRQQIQKIAKLPNVACKISGIVANCAPGTVSVDLLRAYVEHCIEHFSWDRVVWGSDWPVCLAHCDLATWVRLTREIVSDAEEENQRKLLYDNAARIYRVGHV
jgi:predicted TIM-barrel fold metal-dependent hydrolase